MKKLLLFIGACLVGLTTHSQTLSNLNSVKKNVSTSNLKLDKADLSAFASKFFSSAVNKSSLTQADIVSETENWQNAARYARDHKDQFTRLIMAQTSYPDLVNANPGAPVPLRYAAYAILASQGDDAINAYYSKYKISDADKQIIQPEINALKNAINNISSPSVAIFATGDIRGAATVNSSQNTTTGTGTLGVTYTSSKTVYSLKIAIASTQDSIKSGYGSFLLSPSNGSALKSGIFEIYKKITNDDKSWVHFYVTMASSVWQIAQDNTTKTTVTKSASTAGLGLLYRRQLINGLVGNSPVGIDWELGLSGRWLGGDVRNLLLSDEGTAQYLAIFPTKKDIFIGPETGFSLNFGEVTGSFQAYYLFKGDKPIDGLTGLQVTAGLSVRADLINDIFKSK
jgi:hypothetical protein